MSAPAALSPSTIASAAVAVARAAREYLDALSDEQAETVTETKVREHASRVALQQSPRFAALAPGGAGAGAGGGTEELVKSAVAEEVRSFLERRAGAAAGGRGGAGGGRGRGGGTGRAAAAARVKKEEEEEEEEEESKGGRVPRRNAPRKASTASFIVSDDQEEEDEDDYEGEEDSEEDDDDSEEEEEEESDDDDDDDESKAQPPKKKAKRAAATGGRPAATAATSIGESPAVFDNNRRGGGGGGAAAAAANADDAQPSPSIPAVLRLPLGDRRFASVSRLGGVRRLDVREWYLPKEEGGGGGGLKPGLKGISLNAAAVKLLREKTAELDEALAAKRDFSFVLEERAGGGGGAAAAADEGGGGGGSQGGGWQKAPIQKVAATSLWQSVWRVDLREHFLAGGGSWRPTKKGISLSPALWAKLAEALPELESAVAGGGGSSR